MLIPVRIIVEKMHYVIQQTIRLYANAHLIMWETHIKTVQTNMDANQTTIVKILNSATMKCAFLHGNRDEQLFSLCVINHHY